MINEWMEDNKIGDQFDYKIYIQLNPSEFEGNSNSKSKCRRGGGINLGNFSVTAPQLDR